MKIKRNYLKKKIQCLLVDHYLKPTKGILLLQAWEVHRGEIIAILIKEQMLWIRLLCYLNMIILGPLPG